MHSHTYGTWHLAIRIKGSDDASVPGPLGGNGGNDTARATAARLTARLAERRWREVSG